MRKVWFLLALCAACAVGVADGLFWGACANSSGVYFFRSSTPTPGAAECVDKPIKYIVYESGAVREMSQGERDAVDAAALAAYIAQTNAAYIAATNQAAINASNAVLWAEMQVQLDNAMAIEKGVAFATMDQLNLLRAWVVDFKAAVSNSTSLPNLQTRVAALPTFAPITTNGLKTAVRARAEEFR